MKRTWAPLAALVVLLAVAGLAVAQYQSSPQYPSNPMTPGMPGMTPENQSSLTTSPGRSMPAQQYNPLAALLLRIQAPQPSGEVKDPPADAAVLVVRVPDPDADVRFDGQPTYTAGRIRYFVTPHLPDDGGRKYVVAAHWGRGGEATGEREVQAKAGRITVVDFASAERK